MEDIEHLLEDLRIVYADLAKLRQMHGPEMLLPGRVQRYQEALEEGRSAYDRVFAAVQLLGAQLTAEQQRLDLGVRQYGPTEKELDEER